MRKMNETDASDLSKNDRMARAITNMDKWLPSIKTRAQQLGIQSYKELWQRIEPLVTRHPDFFGAISYFEASMVVQGDISHIFLRASNDYRNVAYAVAMAVNTRAEDLFGPVAQAKFVGNTPKEDFINKTNQRFDTLKQEYRLATAQTPLTACLSREFHQEIRAEMDRKLTPVQHSILSAYYGFDEPVKTQQSIAEDVNLSRERISQLLHESLKILSKSNVIKECRRPL